MKECWYINKELYTTIYSSQHKTSSEIKDRQLSYIIFLFACFLLFQIRVIRKTSYSIREKQKVYKYQLDIFMSSSASLNESYVGQNGELLFNMLGLMGL